MQMKGIRGMGMGISFLAVQWAAQREETIQGNMIQLHDMSRVHEHMGKYVFKAFINNCSVDCIVPTAVIVPTAGP